MGISLSRALVALLALSGPGPSSMHAQTSGALIGFRVSSAVEDSGSRYRTLWIVGSSKSARATTLPDLLVPRRDGFWRMGIVVTCGDVQQEGQIDRLWTSRANRRVTLREECPTVPASEVPMIVATTDSAERARLDSVEVICSIRKLDIDFVTGRYLSRSEMGGQTEQCEPRGERFDYSSAVSYWEGSPIAFSDIAGVAADSAFARAARLAVDSASKEDCESFVSDSESRAEAANTVSDWYVARGKGSWQPRVTRSVYGTSCSFDAPIDLKLPASFTGHDVLRPAWDIIARTVPGAVDAMSSPAGDFVIVLTADSLFAYSSHGKVLGTRLLSTPFARDRIVMVEWALGKSAARWDTEIVRLRSTLSPVAVTR